MPDAPRGDLGSVPVWRVAAGSWSYDYTDDDPTGGVSFLRNEPGRWRPLDADDALLGVVEAARVLDGTTPAGDGDGLRDWLVASVNLTRALALLDGKATS